jgi:opacity protein-like surface antigen
MQRTERSGWHLVPGLPLAGARACVLLALAAAAGTAQAQESNFAVTFGTKVWAAEWSTWFFAETKQNIEVIDQKSAKTQAIVIPQLSFRYGDFIGSVSGSIPSKHEFSEPGASAKLKRQEVDVNFGYSITPGLTASLGYKKVDQIDSDGGKYQVSGPTIGVSAASALTGGFSVYGALGLGVLKIKGANNVSADYSLSEVGLGYSLPLGRFIKSMNLSVGYRTQVIKARGLELTNTVTNESVSEDARDMTQGFTLGAVFAF